MTETITRQTPQFAYIDGQLRPGHPELFLRFAEASERAVRERHPLLDHAYGPHPRQKLDLFRTSQRRKGTIVYFHAGYWQARDKSGFRFLAPPLAADGFDVAVVNYPLSPELGVIDIVAAAKASLPELAALSDPAPIILAGHSAGAQIALELGMAERAADVSIAGIMAISGVFDLVPLLDTTVNDKLSLDPASAHAASPLYRVAAGAPPAVFAVGALETLAFREQTAMMAKAWAEAGNVAAEHVIPDADHFSILNEICRAGGVLRTAIGKLL